MGREGNEVGRRRPLEESRNVRPGAASVRSGRAWRGGHGVRESCERAGSWGDVGHASLASVRGAGMTLGTRVLRVCGQSRGRLQRESHERVVLICRKRGRERKHYTAGMMYTLNGDTDVAA